jgi:hypothetical protein
MRIEILDGETVINVINADEAFAQAQHPGAWRVAAQQLQPPPLPETTTITRAQGKAALIQAGMWDAVVAHVAGIADPTERALAEVALHDTLQWHRNSPFLNAAAAALGLTDEQLDALFAVAESVEL